MSTTDPKHCPRCGAPLPESTVEPMCPACLLSGALLQSSDDTLSVAPGRAESVDGANEFPRAFGGYRLLGLLGRGGMGAVYEAVQLDTGRRVALKMLGQQLDTPDVRQRFLREGRLAAGITHPNSLFVFGSEEIEGTPVITMEIAAGGTLKDELNRNGPLEIADAVDAILDVIAGLEAASARGVLHRDIKPSNCFVDPDGTVKVGDFGLSVSTLAEEDSYVTATGVIMGTPAYASPEQLRGDDLDLRSDIYSVGATLFTLLTGKAPFEGNNAVQVVANAVREKPKPVSQLRDGVPPGLERIVARCLAKEPAERLANYADLRDALLPFSSKEPTPAPVEQRLSAGWIDFLIALLPAYVVLMFTVGGDELLVRPLVERTLVSARYYLGLFGIAFLYFTLAEGLFGGGLGKTWKGLRVVRPDGRPAGIPRALIRIAIPIVTVEGVRMPLMMAFISDAEWTTVQTVVYILAAIVCPWIAGLLCLTARSANGFATLWDLLSGTRVVFRPTTSQRRSLPQPTSTAQPRPGNGTASLGPFEVVGTVLAGQWLVAVDPLLCRRVWLLSSSVFEPPTGRREIARPGRLRWLQAVETDGTSWNAFEAPDGDSFSKLIAERQWIPWSELRHWLHDVASELWDASRDGTLPAELSRDTIWITSGGRAIVLDRPWPNVDTPDTTILVDDIAGQQQLLDRLVAAVEPTSVPLHARPLLTNLANGRFEKLSFLAGTLRGLLERPAEVGAGLRVGSQVLFPGYVWVAILVGRYHDKPWSDPISPILISGLLALSAVAVVQLVAIPFRGTVSHSVFRLAVVDASGGRASRWRLLGRWSVVWLPLLGPLAWLQLAIPSIGPPAAILAFVWLCLWVAAAVHAAIHPRHRALHDRLAGTWVVRQ